MANQVIVALNIEALVFAAKAGADPARVRQAPMGGFAASRVLEVHGERMVRRTVDPGFRIERHAGSVRIVGWRRPLLSFDGDQRRLPNPA